MAKTQGGGKLLPLPFTTFGETAALGLKATVYCSRCYQHRPIDPAADLLRDRCFATTRFRCCEIRYTGDVCGCLGSVAIKPCRSVAKTRWPSCSASRVSRRGRFNHVPIDQPPWSVVDRARAMTALGARGAGRPWPGVFTGRVGGRWGAARYGRETSCLRGAQPSGISQPVRRACHRRSNPRY
jgi:hypothetical protein